MTLYARQQKRHRIKNRPLDSVGECKGMMIWENWNMYITICEIDEKSKFDAWNRALKVVHWDDSEGWDGEGGGSGFWVGGHMYIHCWFMSMYGKNHQNIVKWLASN